MRIHEISLDVRLPDGGECGMVLVQPNVPLEPAGTSGFRIGQIERTASTNTIRNICEYLQTHRGQHYDHANFVILPELSVTEEGFHDLEQYVRAATCPSNTIVIAGLEGLPWRTYESLLDRSDNPEGARLKPPNDTVDWVNCLVTFVKQDNAHGIAEVKMYLQSKFEPSQFEQGQERIFEGEDLLLFRLKIDEGQDYSFISLICSDLILENRGRSPIDKALERLRERSATSSINLEFIFGLLYNRSLDNEPFPTTVTTILNGDHSTLDLQDTALVLLNCASQTNTGSNGFGESCLIFHRTSWKVFGPGEYSPRWYTSEEWHGDCRRFRLQENTAAIFTFHYLPIRTVRRKASAKRLPFQDFSCRKITVDGRVDENRSSGLHIRWQKLLHESAPYKNAQTSCTQLPALETTIRQNAGQCEVDIQQVSEVRLRQISSLLFRNHSGHPENYNHWNRHDHGEAMVALLIMASLLRTLNHAVNFQSEPLSTAKVDDSSRLVVLDGKRSATRTEMEANYRRDLEKHGLSISPTLVILTGTGPVPPWQTAAPGSAKVYERATAATEGVPNPNDAYFSPPTLKVGFFDHIQGWREEATSEAALNHVRSYLGKI